MNPAGTAWAGVWNQTDTGNKVRSGLWMIDFEKIDAKSDVLDAHASSCYAPSVGWADDSTVWVLRNDSGDPAAITRSDIVYADAATGKTKSIERLSTPLVRILAWPAPMRSGPGGSGYFLAQIAGGRARRSRCSRGTEK